MDKPICKRCHRPYLDDEDDLAQRLTDQALLIRKMDELANADGTIQTNEATAVLLDKASKVIRLYRARYPDASLSREAALREALEKASGYMTNAAIDLQTGAPKRTALNTIEGGLKMVRAALDQGTPS